MCYFDEIVYLCGCPKLCEFFPCKESEKTSQTVKGGYDCPKLGMGDKLMTLEDFCYDTTCMARSEKLMEIAKERKKWLEGNGIKRQKILNHTKTKHGRKEAEARQSKEKRREEKQFEEKQPEEKQLEDTLLKEKRHEEHSGKGKSTDDLMEQYLQKHPEAAAIYHDEELKAQQKAVEINDLIQRISQLIEESSYQLAVETLEEHMVKEERHMAEKDWQSEEKRKAIFDEGLVNGRLEDIRGERTARQKAVEKEKLIKQIIQLVKERSYSLAVKTLKEHIIIEKQELAEEERQREIRVKGEIGKFDDHHRAVVTSWLDTVPIPKGMERVWRIQRSH